MKEEFDFESIKNKAIEQLKAGKPLLGKDGAFAPLLESILNAALEGEMDTHLTEEERQMSCLLYTSPGIFALESRLYVR